MVVTKLRTINQPTVKKAHFQSPASPGTSRIAELPSLRYGPIGSNKKVLGPLRIQNTYNFEDKKQSQSSRKLNSATDKPPRSVRFILPPSSTSSSADSCVSIGKDDARDAGNATVARDDRRQTSTSDAPRFKRNRCSCNFELCGPRRSLCINCCNSFADKSSPNPRTFEELVSCYKPTDVKWLLKERDSEEFPKLSWNSPVVYSRPPRTRVTPIPNSFYTGGGGVKCASLSSVPACKGFTAKTNNFNSSSKLKKSSSSCLNNSICGSRNYSRFSTDNFVNNNNNNNNNSWRDSQSGTRTTKRTKSGVEVVNIESRYITKPSAPVLVSVSPADGRRVHPTGFYIRGTLSPTTSAGAPVAAPPSGGQALLQAARDGDDDALHDILKRAAMVGIPPAELNAADNSGRTALSYIVSNGPVDLLQQILQLPGLNPNQPDNEGNTPLHFAAQAGQTECMNVLLTRCKKVIEIDARNNLGFTPLMKAALQGRSRCAKLLLLSGANPTLRDHGRGFRADQWARFCGRYLCADVIEKHARQRLLEKSTSYGNWGGENETGPTLVLTKPVQTPTPQQHGLRHKLRKVFRTSSNTSVTSQRLITQLTSAALCASTPVLPTAPKIPPVVKSLIRPLTVPQLQITLVSNNNDEYTDSNNKDSEDTEVTKNNFDDKVRLEMIEEASAMSKY